LYKSLTRQREGTLSIKLNLFSNLFIFNNNVANSVHINAQQISKRLSVLDHVDLSNLHLRRKTLKFKVDEVLERHNCRRLPPLQQKKATHRSNVF
ncbi:hypothetical protein L9F63_008485, partial [Diploptera punctata]